MKPHIYLNNGRWSWSTYGKTKAPGTLQDLMRMYASADSAAYTRGTTMTLKDKTMYVRMIQCLAARSCYDAGQSIRDIATAANKSPSTIRRWLKKMGGTMTADRRPRNRPQPKETS